MADGEGTSNSAIIAIVAIIAIALGFLYYMGVFGKETVTKDTVIERPATPNGSTTGSPKNTP